MRTIKFRGRISKGLENAGEWVYWGINGTDLLDAIDKDTIGQFTGLKDKNGKEIYEGDIVLVKNQGEYADVEPIEGKGEIKFNDGGYKVFGFYNMALGEKVCSGSEGNWNIEVIGNIHENPELLRT